MTLHPSSVGNRPQSQAIEYLLRRNMPLIQNAIEDLNQFKRSGLSPHVAYLTLV